MKSSRFLFPLIFITFVVLPQTIFAAISYGSVSEYLGGNNILVKYKEIGKEEKYSCNLSDFSCVLKNGESESKLEGVSSDVRYFFNADKNRMVAEQKIAGSDLYAVSIFKVENNKASFESSIPVNSGIKKALWADGADKTLVLTRRNNLVLYDAEKQEKDYELSFGEDRYSRLLLSPKGNFLAYYAAAVSPEKKRVFGLIDLRSGKKYELTYKIDYWDLLSEQIRLLEFSPDESRFVYLDDKDDALTLYSVDLKKLSGKKLSGKRIITKDYSVADFLFGNSDDLFFIANRENPLQWSLYSYNLKTEKLNTVAKKVSYANGLEKFGTYIGFAEDNEGAMNPVFYDPQIKEIKKLSIAKSGESDKQDAVPVKIGKIYGAFLKAEKPSDKLLIWLHGGPYRQTSLGFHPYLSYGTYDEALYAGQAAGANILKLDYSGSFGYGREFAERLKSNVGKADVADVVAAYNYAKKNWGIKEAYLMGNSYGGYLALKALVENPDKFNGAFSVNGVTNWKILTDRLEDSIFNVHFGGLYSAKTKKLYEQSSILASIPKLGNQKIILAYGTEDRTIPFDQAGLLYENLVSAGKNAELVAYEGEEHVLSKQETIDDLSKRVIAFLGL